MAILSKTTGTQNVTKIKFNGVDRVDINATQGKYIDVEFAVQKTPGQTGGRIEFYTNATATPAHINTIFTKTTSEISENRLVGVDGKSFEFRLPQTTTTVIKISGFVNGTLSYSLIADDDVLENGFITGLTNIAGIKVYAVNKTKPNVVGVINHASQIKISD